MNPTLLLVQKYRWESLFESIYPEFGSHLWPIFSQRTSMANLLSILRLILSPFLLYPEPLSPLFFVLYGFLGLTDMADGWIARKTKTTSKLGSYLDSIGDIVFLLFAFLAIYPKINFTLSSLLLILIVFVLRMANIISSLIREKKVILLHTFLNKAVGFLLFLFPFSLTVIPSKFSIPFISTIALCASLDEGYLIWKRKSELFS